MANNNNINYNNINTYFSTTLAGPNGANGNVQGHSPTSVMMMNNMNPNQMKN